MYAESHETGISLHRKEMDAKIGDCMLNNG
jgi:hypothetical protein